MTVKELIEELQKLEQDKQIYIDYDGCYLQEPKFEPIDYFGINIDCYTHKTNG